MICAAKRNKHRAAGTIQRSFLTAVGLLSLAAVAVTPAQAQTDTPTETPTATPTCAPTGTPYCSDNCQPCPTVRPNCYASACGFCIQNPLTCDPGEVRDCSPNPAPISGCCACVTPTPTRTPSEISTDTPTETPTATRTVTPTSCRGDLPVVAPVSSPTNLLEQVIHFCGRIVGSSSMGVSSEAGTASDIGFASSALCPPCPNPGNATCNQGTVPLLPNQTNHIMVCQDPGSGCAPGLGGGCVGVDVNGDPLEIIQVPVTPTPSATPTPPGDVGSPECLNVQLAAQENVSAGGPYRNHGALVRTATKVVSGALTAGEITEACAGCIMNQFARRIPIAEQTPCGEALGCCTFSGPICTQVTQTACATAGGQFFPGAFCAPEVGVCFI